MKQALVRAPKKPGKQNATKQKCPARVRTNFTGEALLLPPFSPNTNVFSLINYVYLALTYNELYTSENTI